MKRALVLLVAGTLASGAAAWRASAQDATARVAIARLDCGTVQANDLNLFSDTDAYVGKRKTLAASCYLIRHGDDYLLWDTGLPAALKGKSVDPKAPMSPTVRMTILEQLPALGVRPDQIGRVGISHYHFDHVGQAASFPNATLTIGAKDWAALSADKPDPQLTPQAVGPWLKGGKVDAVSGDRDLYGDGTVRMVALPGHTPDHHGLLVKLPRKGYVLLSGDQAHFTENYVSNGVPSFNVDRGDTLASFDRFKKMAANLKATVILQHEQADVAKLPAYPGWAD